MGKPAQFNSVDKISLYIIGLFLSGTMALAVNMMGDLKIAAQESHDHEITANITLDGMKKAQSEVKAGLKKIQRQVSVVCNTQRQYWPTHAKNCI